MSDHFQTDAFDAQPPDLPAGSEPPELRRRRHPPLPEWLAGRLLRPDEQVAWVVGPRFNPSWELYVTHPGLFFTALAVGVVCVLTGRIFGESWSEMPLWPPLVAGGLAVASVIVLGFCCGYFTRLVVTNNRLLIVQGQEICRSWNINDLPPSLLRYRLRDRDNGMGPSVDLDALQAMLGSASDQFTDAKTILSLRKQLGQIKTREDDRP